MLTGTHEGVMEEVSGVMGDGTGGRGGLLMVEMGNPHFNG